MFERNIFGTLVSVVRNSGEKLVTGKTYRVEGPIELCFNGLHASRYVYDADDYVPIKPGRYLCRVKLSGTIVGHEEDKYAASERTILWKKKLTPKDKNAFHDIWFSVGKTEATKRWLAEKLALSLEPKKRKAARRRPARRIYGSRRTDVARRTSGVSTIAPIS